MSQVSAISQQIWDMKYRLKSAEGHALDKTIADTWTRVARAAAAAEKDPAGWEARFAEAMDDFRFLPAGRIFSGAGSGRRVTLFNCFVMGQIPDDMTGIFEHLKEAALTMQQGGGIGYDFSTLRPKGAPVKGVGADASGPLTFMDVWDAMCRTIMSAGSRRGAMMGVMRCDHPDIEDFIEAKRQPGRLRMFNLSVLVTDAFMQAVREDAAWELAFGGTVFRNVRARELWDRIMRATYTYAEPGVVFIDRINRMNNLAYCETIHATNPCITADTWVQTTEGPRQVADLVGRPFAAVVNGAVHGSGPEGFFATGVKPVLWLAAREGFALRLTWDHPVRRVVARTRYRVESEWTRAGDLAPGDEILLNDHRSLVDWPGFGGEGEGYLLGLLVGDGTLKADAAVLSVWRRSLAAGGETAADGAESVMAAALDAARALPHRADFAGWVEVAGRGESRLKLAALRDLAFALGMTPGDKRIAPPLERAASDFYRGFLRGLFDTDGSVQGTQAKGVSIRLAQSDLARLEATQRMLLRLGIVSTLYQERRPAGTARLPDGRGGTKDYATQAQHELVIAGENVARFAARIGFADTAKAARLSMLLSAYKRTLNRERFVSTVESLAPDGQETVFDVRIPGVNAFDANGFVVHNCGEQPLPPYGACLLGSINLARLVHDPFAENAHLDLGALEALARTAVRLLDNVIDVSAFPLPRQEHEAKAKRRIGLGVTGLADALIMCRARYGGAQAVRLAEAWMKTIQRSAYLASTELAAEKGAFPLFDKEKYLASETVRTLDEDVRAAIAKNGIRNGLLTSVAPTGTISLFADNVSSGLEPVFSFVYARHVLMPDGSRREEQVSDYAYRLFRKTFGDGAPLPDYFVDAQALSPADHLVMQAAVQRHVDSSISKTINCPEGISFEDFKDIYLKAYELGCKGCTTYRPNEITGAVLETRPGKAKGDQPELPLGDPRALRPGGLARPLDAGDSGAIVYMTQPLDRPEVLQGGTYKVRWPETDHAMYITLNDVIQDGRRRPFEVFINSKNMEHFAWTVALTRMISAVFRRGGDVSFVVEELKAVFDPRGGQWMGGRYVPSLLAAIGEVIERHMIAIGFLSSPHAGAGEARVPRVAAAGGGEAPAPSAHFRQCPKCAEAALIRQEGCDVCTSCTYSKCA
ncbi:MAG: ribonucleoside reductase [Rhodospirillales bacterium RIFCSPLOWO2_12_FULL_67_15]|nr:MAG: ribonucleoside reductase [Rhodospirillales bacterium RIFCSPLOWO2_12_FULL_67_15]